MIDILRGTPLWVYAVFLMLSYYGVIACFRNHVSKRSLQISPVIFVALSLASLNPS
jgi:ABC-type amino acid transport system permease subunit